MRRLELPQEPTILSDTVDFKSSSRINKSIPSNSRRSKEADILRGRCFYPDNIAQSQDVVDATQLG